VARPRSRRLGRWLLGGVVALAVLVFGGTWVYIHLIEGPAPAPLGLKAAPNRGTTEPASSTAPASTTTASPMVAGSWRVAAGSIVGYRVNEVLAGQDNVAVGRTTDISGTMTIRGSTVTAATFTVQMATVKSDESERDVQFNGRIMQTASYPTGTLRLTSAIALGGVPAEGQIKSYHVTANLTLRGRTRPVTFTLEAERTPAGIEVAGSIPIHFADWGISNPSFPPFVTTQNHGLLEFLIKFER
jgi:polyisoprenoid-binding protein YceI